MSDPNNVTGGVALAEPPSSAPTVRFPALHDLTIGLTSQRNLPAVPVTGAPAVAVDAAVGLAVSDHLAVRNGPIAGMAASRDGSLLVTTNHGDDSVSVIDTASGAVGVTLTGLLEPFAIANGGTRAYLSTATPAYDVIAALDLDTGNLVGTYAQARPVRDVAVSPDGKLVYASRTGADGADVAVLDADTEQVTVIELVSEPGASADRLVVSSDGTRLYVAVQRPSGSALMVIDSVARRVLGSIGIGFPIRDIALSADGNIAYVAGCGPDSDVVDIVDTRALSIIAGMEIGTVGAISQLLLSNDGERVYLVTESGVAVVSTLTRDIVGGVALDAQPSCAVESPDGSRLYVADYTGAVTVVSVPWAAASLVDQVGEVMNRPELPELESVLI